MSGKQIILATMLAAASLLGHAAYAEERAPACGTDTGMDPAVIAANPVVASAMLAPPPCPEPEDHAANTDTAEPATSAEAPVDTADAPATPALPPPTGEQLQALTAKIDTQSAELDARQAVLDAATRRLDERYAALDALHNVMQAQLADPDNIDPKGLQQLVTLYSAMKPGAAAADLEGLPDSVLVPLARAMPPRTLAAITGKMQPARADALTTQMAAETPLTFGTTQVPITAQ